MEKDILIRFIDDRLSSREIARKIFKSQCSVKYWLKKYGLKTKFEVGNLGGNNPVIRKRIAENGCAYLCKYCGETDPSKFMKTGSIKRLSYSRCKKCHSIYTTNRFRKNKLRAVQYKGGCCEMCGYNKCVDSLHFHHKDPKTKDSCFDNFKSRIFEKIKYELDKCILLCANCHGELHYNIRNNNHP